MPDPSLPRAFRLGVAGPVGTGKSSLIALVCRELGERLSMGVITNDIYTDEDAQFLRSAGVLDPARIRAVETGACPHTAIRDDVTANLLAVEDLEADYGDLELLLLESGGDNLTATFSPALVDAQIFVLDVAGGGDVARKGGPGIARADLLVLNKTDLAPYVGVDVEQMLADATAAREGGPVLCLSRADPVSVAALTDWVTGMVARRPGRDARRDRPRSDGPARARARGRARGRRRPPPSVTAVVASPRRASVRTSVRLRAGVDGRVAVELEDGHLSARVLERDRTTVRLALVSTVALLLGGDDVVVDVDVGPGVHAEIVEIAGVVAYDMRGSRASWTVRASVGAGATLLWEGLPLVVSAGADVVRALSLELHADALCLLRETVVLGRTGEVGGDLLQTTDVRRPDGHPVLREDLDLTRAHRDTPVVLGGARCLDTVTLLGARLALDGPEVLQLHEPGTVVRSLTGALHESHVGSAMAEGRRVLDPGRRGA